ncbi:MAG: prolyl oligopeptidase family serine peptidase [Rhodospirillaceae bacterium]|nr:prolyl oligopeptidase family serine peptidase [Rhodospirillaceae bacterium]
MEFVRGILLALVMIWTGHASATDIAEAVQFSSADMAKTEIGGLVVKPAGPGPFPGVVMLHGCAGLTTKSGKLRKRPMFWSKWLAARGYLVLMTDSFGPRGHGSICSVKNRPVRPDKERPFDAYGALRYLQGRGDVRADNVALMGWSNGAMALLWAIKSPAEWRPSNLRHDFRAAIGFYPGCTKISKTPHYVTKIPTALLLGELDDWTPAKPCLRFAATAAARSSPIHATLYEGAYHNFDHPTAKVKTVLTRNSESKRSERRVHSGGNADARRAAIDAVDALLKQHAPSAQDQ